MYIYQLISHKNQPFMWVNIQSSHPMDPAENLVAFCGSNFGSLHLGPSKASRKRCCAPRSGYWTHSGSQAARISGQRTKPLGGFEGFKGGIWWDESEITGGYGGPRVRNRVFVWVFGCVNGNHERIHVVNWPRPEWSCWVRHWWKHFIESSFCLKINHSDSCVKFILHIPSFYKLCRFSFYRFPHLVFYLIGGLGF